MIDWVESCDRTRFRVFAVNISHSCGLILLCKDPDSYPLKLHRIGCYQLLSFYACSDEGPVNWIVLQLFQCLSKDMCKVDTMELFLDRGDRIL
jgi:hypothetical protein